MTSIRALLKQKDGPVWSTTPSASVYDALALMAEKNVGALPVMDGRRIVGMVSERDYARKVILKGKHSRETRIAEIMTVDVVTVSPDQSVEECMMVMTERRIRHLPVVEDALLVGLISIGDVVKHIIEDQRSTIHHLEDYITGRR